MYIYIYVQAHMYNYVYMCVCLPPSIYVYISPHGKRSFPLAVHRWLSTSSSTNSCVAAEKRAAQNTSVNCSSEVVGFLEPWHVVNPSSWYLLTLPHSCSSGRMAAAPLKAGGPADRLTGWPCVEDRAWRMTPMTKVGNGEWSRRVMGVQ